MTDFLAAAENARQRGLPHLEAIFRKLAIPATRLEPIARSKRPRICLVVDHKGWCGERLFIELANQLTEYDCRIVRLGDREHLALDFDLYIYRNAAWLSTCNLPSWVYKRIVCIVEGHRVLDHGYGKLFPRVRYTVPMTGELMARVKEYGASNVWPETIANGVSTTEFYPSDKFPKEFTVGAAGNFSIEYYDNWKGFSRYIVPACQKAEVKLDWCSWRGKCQALPALKGSYIRPDKMTDWYRGLSCLVMMSQSEGCSGVTFEAMATGLPIISTKVGWHGETCKDEIIWTTRPKQETPDSIRSAVNELAKRLRKLKQDYSLCIAMGKKNRLFAERYSHAQIADKWRNVIASALQPQD